MITEKKINYLFQVLWPGMMYYNEHNYNCIEKFAQIERLFIKHKLDFNSLLAALSEINGIGITIGTGLIWVAYQGKAIPFDKWTTSYCLELGWLRSYKITQNYKQVCNQVLTEINSYSYSDGSRYTVKDFVREAYDKMIDSEWLQEAE